MPEYLAPGVYVEEVSFRAKSIEGVSTSTAAFVGPTRFGPTSGEPELLTSFADFERIYGGLEPLNFGGAVRTNYLAYGVRAFFEEGGSRLYVARVYAPPATDSPLGDGRATTTNTDTLASPPPTLVTLRARFPGAAGEMRVTFLPRFSPPVPLTSPRLQEHDTVAAVDTTSPIEMMLYDMVRTGDTLVATNPDDPTDTLSTTAMVRILTVDLLIERPIIRPQRPKDRFGESEFLEGFALHPQHRLGLVEYFTERPDSRLLHLTVPLQIDADSALTTGSALALALIGPATLMAAFTGDLERARQPYQLTGGSDGLVPGLDAYSGESEQQAKSGLAALEDLEDISILAAPGHSFDYTNNANLIIGIQNALRIHCEKMRYRIAVLDAPNDQIVSQIREFKGRIDSTRAALYYPWIKILDPLSSQELLIPPSGTVAGIYARNDVDHGVHKTPANEVVRQAIGFEFLLNKAQQDVLNPEGINCFRFFEGRGYRLWGGRTTSSDPEWKYVNVRRYFLYLERSIELGTQWVVFENNGPAHWANVRRTVEDFLFNEWKSGRLLGEKPELAYFVRCDRSTMTQNDLDNGRLICLIGVAPLRPAEFVIFRIGQFTADRPA